MSSASEANFPRGGTSTKSTPANNIGEGSSGLGDSGYPKGSGSATGNFNTLTHQKKPGKQQQEGLRSGSEESSVSSKDDGGFMGHRPGGSETLPGWNKMKEFAGYGT